MKQLVKSFIRVQALALVLFTLALGQSELAAAPEIPVPDYEADEIETESFEFLDYHGNQLVLDLNAARNLTEELEQPNSDYVLVPEDAQKARSKDEFVRIVAEHNLQYFMEKGAWRNTGIARRIEATEKAMKGGLSYEIQGGDADTKPQGIRAYIEPQQITAHLTLETERLTTDLLHSFDRNSSEFALIVPELFSGELVMAWELSSSRAKLNYELFW